MGSAAEAIHGGAASVRGPGVASEGGWVVKRDELQVVVVEDPLALRKGVELLLRREGLRVTGVAETADEGRRMIVDRRPDVPLAGHRTAVRRGDGEHLRRVNLHHRDIVGWVPPDEGRVDARAPILPRSGLRRRASPSRRPTGPPAA